MIDEASGPCRLLSGRGDAAVGGAGTVSARRTGQGAGKAVGTFRPLVARYGLKNVPTPIEIIAELLACHAGGRGFEPRRSRHDFKGLSCPSFSISNF
jgi:hypothetical protein